jgi:Domain of unknown function (DUF6321)
LRIIADMKTRKPVWKRAAPAKAKHHSLTPAKKSAAKQRAKRAGRPYPNLVDNMRAARRSSKKSGATKRKSAKKRTAKKRAPAKKRKSASKRANGAKRTGDAKARKSAKGGLTAQGRDWYRRKQGAHLKPGVKASVREMTPPEMRRKGSWAVRFYGRSGALPPLVNKKGEPTRLALTAAAWGEPVPKTVAAARKIAAKGRRLLTAYHRTQG